MSHRRASRGRRPRRGDASSPAPAEAPRDRPSGGTSKLVIAFALFVGLFVGRVVSILLGGDVLFVVDLAIYAGIAACIALAFRRSARRAVERRQRDRLRRARASDPEEPGERA